MIPTIATLGNISRLGSGGGGGAISSQSFAIQLSTATNLNPLDATTYYFANAVAGATVTLTQARIYVQKKCIMKKIYGHIVNTTAATTEQSTLSIVVNETTEYVISNTIQLNGTNVNAYNNTSLNMPLNPGDYYCFKRVTPTWATDPSNVRLLASMWFDCAPVATTGSYLLQCGVSNLALADSTTYYLYDDDIGSSASAINKGRIYIPASGTITSAQVYTRAGILGSNEQFTYAIRVNNTTNYNITTTAAVDALSNTFSNLSMSVPVSEGDYVCLIIISPVWTTNPTCSHRFSFVIDRG